MQNYKLKYTGAQIDKILDTVSSFGTIASGSIPVIKDGTLQSSTIFMDNNNDTHINGSVLEGHETTNIGNYNHLEGHKSTTDKTANYTDDDTYSDESELVYCSHVEGNATICKSRNSHAEGKLTKTQGSCSHAEGYATLAGDVDTPEDVPATLPDGTNEDDYKYHKNAHAEGADTKALGHCSHAEGRASQALLGGAHAEGFGSMARAPHSHAEGQATYADAPNAHSEGRGTHAEGPQSHAEGRLTYAQGENSHAGGISSKAQYFGSFVHGNNCNTHYDFQTVFGQFNDESNSEFIIGDGIDGTHRNNLFEVSHNLGNCIKLGNTYLSEYNIQCLLQLLYNNKVKLVKCIQQPQEQPDRVIFNLIFNVPITFAQPFSGIRLRTTPHAGPDKQVGCGYRYINPITYKGTQFSNIIELIAIDSSKVPLILNNFPTSGIGPSYGLLFDCYKKPLNQILTGINGETMDTNVDWSDPTEHKMYWVPSKNFNSSAFPGPYLPAIEIES